MKFSGQNSLIWSQDHSWSEILKNHISCLFHPDILSFKPLYLNLTQKSNTLPYWASQSASRWHIIHIRVWIHNMSPRSKYYPIVLDSNWIPAYSKVQPKFYVQWDSHMNLAKTYEFLGEPLRYIKPFCLTFVYFQSFKRSIARF